jgi:hypothetical protein
MFDNHTLFNRRNNIVYPNINPLVRGLFLGNCEGSCYCSNIQDNKVKKLYKRAGNYNLMSESTKKISLL